MKPYSLKAAQLPLLYSRFGGGFFKGLAMATKKPTKKPMPTKPGKKC